MIIKEFLVALGAKVDISQLDKGLRLSEKMVSRYGGTLGGAFVGAAAAAAIGIAAVNAATAKYLYNVASADRETERFARRMFISYQSAKDLNQALSTMGKSFEDIYQMTEEEFTQFNSLRKLSRDIGQPADYRKQMQQIRAVGYELQRLQLIFKKLKERVAYFGSLRLGKYMESGKNLLQRAAAWLTENLDKIADKIAFLMEIFARLASAGYSLGKAILWVVDTLKNLLPSSLLVAGGAVAGFLGLLSLGPVGAFLAAILALLLLIDDYKTYKRGGQSLFGDEYAELEAFLEKMKESESLQDFLAAVREIGDGLGLVWEWLVKIFNGIREFANDNDLWQKLMSLLDKLLEKAGKLAGESKDWHMQNFEDATKGTPFEGKFNLLRPSKGQAPAKKMSLDDTLGRLYEVGHSGPALQRIVAEKTTPQTVKSEIDVTVRNEQGEIMPLEDKRIKRREPNVITRINQGVVV